MIRKLMAFGFIVLALSPAAYGAAPANSGDEAILFDDIPSVFGASKYEQRVEEAPASVSIVSADEIRKYGYRTLADVMRSQRGMYVSYDRNYTYLGVRGFSRPTDYNSRVLLLIDGHRTNENIYHMALLGTENIIDVDLIDHIEIIRGPSSSLYGTNALFGVINVITKRGRDYQGGELSAEAGRFQTGKARVSYGTRLSGGTEVLAALSAYRADGDSRLYFPEFDDPATNNGVAENNDGGQARNAFFKLSRGDLSLEAGYVHRAKEVPTASYGATFNDPSEGTVDRQGFFVLQYDAELNDMQRMTVNASYDAYRYDGTYSNALDALGDPTGELTKDYGDGRWWTLGVQLTGRVAVSHRYVAGVEFQYNARQDQGNVTLTPYEVFLDDHRSTRQWSLFLQDEWQVSPEFIVNVGLRHDNYSEWGGTTNPRLALIYLASPATAVKMLYGEAYRAPSPYELYYTPSPWLKPETMRTIEFALEHTLRGNLRAVATAYQYWVDDLINQQDDYTFRNTGDAVTQGVELELDGHLLEQIEGRVSYSWQRARDTVMNAALSNSPQHLAKLNLGIPLFDNQLHAALEIQYMSARDTLAGSMVDGYTVGNFTLLSRRWIPRLELSASVYNITDTSFADPGGQEHLQDSISQDGRTWRIKALYEIR